MAKRKAANQRSTTDDSVPPEISFRKRISLCITPEHLDAMKAMVQETKQDPFSVLKNFSLPDDLLIEQLKYLPLKGSFTANTFRSLNDIEDELNEMKAMVEKAKQDPTSLLKNFESLPKDLLMEQSKYLQLKNPLSCTKPDSFFSKAA